jgi:Homing endonuclease associated repeat
MRYSDEQILNALREFGERLGRTPTAAEWKRFGRPYESTIVKRFGSFSEACRRAGIEPRPSTRPPVWSDEQLLDALREAAERLGRTPTLKDLGRPSGATLIGRFRSWEQACRLVGLEPRGRDWKPAEWSEAEILEAIRRWAERHGRPPTMRDWGRAAEDRPTASMVGRRIGWSRALYRAGFEPRPVGFPPRSGGGGRPPQPRCGRGHSLEDPGNVVYDGRGGRSCRICKRARDAAYARRRRTRLKAA